MNFVRLVIARLHVCGVHVLICVHVYCGHYRRRQLWEHGSVSLAASALVEKALTCGSTDNISAVVICLNQKSTNAKAVHNPTTKPKKRPKSSLEMLTSLSQALALGSNSLESNNNCKIQ